MSLKYFGRYRFNNVADMGEEDFGNRDLALESGNISTITDVTYGEVLSMDGATSLLSMGTFSNVSGALDRSFSFWASNDVVNLHNPVFSYGDLEPDNAFVIYSSNSNSNPEFYDHTTYRTVSSHTSTVSNWNFYTITYNSITSTLNIYIDGVQQLSDSFTLDTGISDPLRIGTDGLGNYFDGSISDFRMFNFELDSSAVTYMFSVGPNFEEKLDVNYVDEASTRGVSMCGPLMSKSSLGVKDSNETIGNSFHLYDDNGTLQEAARIDYKQDVNDSSTNMSVQMRHTETTTSDTVLMETISLNPISTTFTSVDNNEKKTSVVFSSSGVSITSGEPGGMYFGASKDFRIAVENSSAFIIQAYDSVSDQYITKLEVHS